ncbi:hypothetical protein T439DRAFT_234192 [Meredithblackwellia eburnea MCA 4105]
MHSLRKEATRLQARNAVLEEEAVARMQDKDKEENGSLENVARDDQVQGGISDNTKKEINLLRKELDQCRQEIDMMKNGVQVCQSELVSSMAQIDKLKAQLVDKDGEVAKMKVELADKTKLIDGLKRERQMLDSAATEKVDGKVGTLEIEVHLLKTKVSAAEQDAARSKAEVERLTNKISLQAAEHAKVKVELSSSLAKYQSLQSLHTSAKDTLSKLEQKMKEANKNENLVKELQNKLQNETTQLNAAYAQLAKKNQSNLEAADTLQKAIDEGKESATKLKNQLYAAQFTITKLRDNEAKAKDSWAKAREAWDAMAHQVSFFQARNDFLERSAASAVSSLQADIKAKEYYIQTGRLMHQSQQTRIEELEWELECSGASRKGMDTLKTVLERNELRRQVDFLQARCDETQKELERQAERAKEQEVEMQEKLDAIEEVAKTLGFLDEVPISALPLSPSGFTYTSTSDI